MLYQVLNSSKNPAGTEVTNPDALFQSIDAAKEFVDYLHNECSLENEQFTIVPFFREIDTDWTFVECYYPNYHSCDTIKESNDLQKIIDNEAEPDDELYASILESAYLNNIKSSEEELKNIVYNIANDRLNAVNSIIYQKVIEGFINHFNPKEEK